MECNLCLLFAVVGFCYLSSKFVGILCFIYKSFLRKEINLIERYGKCWVAVTAASDGIGRAYCDAFAKRGFNICLISRTKSKLETAAKEISEKYNVQTRIIEANFENALQPDFCENIVKQLPDDVGILVNNVGVGSSFFENKLDGMMNVININVYSTTYLTKLMIDKLKSRPTKSAIITLSSVSGNRPTPGLTVYSATKAYDRFLSICLSEEYREKIDCLSVTPSVVKTTLAKNLHKNIAAISASECVESSLLALGREVETCGHWKHILQNCFYGTLPQKYYRRVCVSSFKKAFLKKLENTLGNEEKKNI